MWYTFMNKRARIGVLGGTFDPIHIGHLIIAENAYYQCELDKVLIMPSGVSYMKQDRNISSKEDRLNMCKLAVAGNPHLEVSDIEIKRSGNTYTADTLTYLTDNNPDCDFYFITGADTFTRIENWYQPDTIFNKCTIIVCNRKSNTESEVADYIKHYSSKYNADIISIESPTIDISSSDIRTRLSAGEYVRYILTESVSEYIARKKLYNTGIQ